MRTRSLLTILIPAGVMLAACGSDSNTSSTAAASTTVAAATTTAASTDGTSSPAAAATVATATDPELGSYLVDAKGRTLYLFEKDQGTTTACTGGCADNWPPLVSSGAPAAGDGVDAAQLSTANGVQPNQVTYHGHLLYYFAGDQAAGDTNGVGIPSWYTVDPAGAAIDKD